MSSGEQLYLGIDVGTGGVRALAVSESGEVAAIASVPFDSQPPAPRPGWHEQSPEMWWRTVRLAIGRLLADPGVSGIRPSQFAALAVDGTSGTLVVLDEAAQPLRPAMMYNDARGEDEASEINATAGEFCHKLGYQFKSSFALAKIAWLANHEPECFAKAARFVHQADFIVGRLTGDMGVSDYSNALKTGYDLIEEQWPAWCDPIVGGIQRLPRVVAPGVPVGKVSATAAAETGLAEGLPVVAGASDGTAACLASGVRRSGDYNTTLGTTMVFKGISERICRHPLGLIYCHKLPGGLWLPGAASNTGCEWITTLFSADPREMDAAAADHLPIDCLAYPLARTGERFPLLSKTAEAFFVPEREDAVGRYAACLQGVALLERLCYQVLDDVAGTAGGEVYSTGGGTKSSIWTQCRADATGRVIHRPACGESAFGVAVLAAVGTRYGTLAEAIEGMVRIEKTFQPNPDHAPAYDELFNRFRDELHRRGYL